jgi:hypothetical protein
MLPVAALLRVAAIDMEIGHPVNQPDRAWHTMDDTAEAGVLDISLQSSEIAGFGSTAKTRENPPHVAISVV